MMANRPAAKIRAAFRLLSKLTRQFRVPGVPRSLDTPVVVFRAGGFQFYRVA